MIFSTTPTEEPNAERVCSGCGKGLEPDQLACLECGAVTATGSSRERRWLFRTSTVAGAALLLVTSASFAATTAMKSGDPHAMKPPAKPQVAQAPPAAIPPASGDGTAEGLAEAAREKDEQDEQAKADPAPAPAPAPAAPAPAPSDDSGDSGSGSGSGSGGSNSGGSGGSDTGSDDGTDTGTDEEEPTPTAELTAWETKPEGSWTVVVYRFPDKAGAKRKAQEAAGKELAAGVILSDNFPSLDPGSYLVFIGQFATEEEATAAQSKYDRAGYPGEVTFVGEQPAEPPASGAAADQYDETAPTPSGP